MQNSQNSRDIYFRSQLFALTLSSTFQRNKIYSAKASQDQKLAVRAALRKQLEKAEAMYEVRTSDLQHEQAIAALAKAMTKHHGPALYEGRFRIGTAQKALNLWLKHLWCARKLAIAPPHCPFDRIIIQALAKEVRHHAWTSLDTISAYRSLVAAARISAGSLSIAEWELREYNRS